jgi:hypothetical protein
MLSLTTKLLQLPRSASKVADLLWRLADPSALTYARTSLSDDVWSEQMMLGLPDRLATLARLMDRPERVDIASAIRDVRLALVDNPRSDTGLLTVLAADADAEVAARANARLDLHRQLLAAPSDQAVAQQVADKMYASAIAELYAADNNAALALLAGCEQKELALRGIVVDLIGSNGGNTNAVRSALVGVLDNGFAAHVVDHELAEWLVSSDCVQAECSRDTVIESLGTKKAEVASRLVLRATAEAVGILADSQMYANLSHPRLPQLPPHAKWMDASMIDAMADSGLPTQAVAALVFNSIGELPQETVDRIVMTTIDDSPAQVLAFLLGQQTRKPDREDVKRILPTLTDDQSRSLAATYAKVAVELEGKLPDVPWRLELLRFLPGLFKGQVEDDDLVGVDRRMTSELGDRDDAWQFAIALAAEWEQSLDALLSAAKLA